MARDKLEGTEQYLGIQGVIVHEHYDAASYANDIALLITDKDIEFNQKVQPISLPEDVDVKQLYAEGAPVTVIGEILCNEVNKMYKT